MFAEDKTIDNTIIYNYKLLKENNTFIYLNILQASQTINCVVKRAFLDRLFIKHT